MTNEEAARILFDHNAWRRDENTSSDPPRSGYVIGKAIDVAIAALTKPETFA